MSFLLNYAKFTAGNECPQIFHFWSSISALSSIVSRRVGFSFSYFTIHPNLYIVLVGSPGTRKTSAMETAKELVREMRDIPFSAECVTKQAITQDMGLNCVKTYNNAEGKIVQYTPYTVFSTELSHFLGMGTAKEMVDFLTTIYDRPFYDVKTKNKGNDVIVGPYFNLLSCTTPDWIRGWMKEDVITGGFARRGLFVYYTGPRIRKAIPEITQEMKDAWEMCVKRGEELKQIHGMFTMSPEALAWYVPWYEAMEIPQDHTGGYFESKHIQMIKVAMLIALSEGNRLVLELNHLKLALAQLELVEVNLKKVFDGVGRNELNKIAAQIIDFLEMNKGELPKKQLEAIMFKEANADELYKALQHLQSTERIEILEVENKITGKKKQVVALKQRAAELVSQPAPVSQPKPVAGHGLTVGIAGVADPKPLPSVIPATTAAQVQVFPTKIDMKQFGDIEKLQSEAGD